MKLLSILKKILLEDQAVIDRILDKISEKGIKSLTPEEKEYLTKYSKGEKNILEPTSGETKIFVSNQDSQRFKVENFPALPKVEKEIEFECNDEEECVNNEDYQKLLQVKKFKNILEKIIKFSYNNDPEQNLYNSFHGFILYGDFDSPQPIVNIQLSGDGFLYIMDNENFGNEDTEYFGLKTWKEL